MRGMFLLVSIFSGVISSLMMGLLFKWMEKVSQIKVYTLLLTIDFIPIINQIDFSETVEFIFHMIVSILLTIILYRLFQYYDWSEKHVVVFGSGISVLIGLLTYPITLLSDTTPSFVSFAAIVLWSIGHLLYGATMSVLFIISKRLKCIH